MMQQTKLAIAMEKYGETNVSLSRKLDCSAITVRKWRNTGIVKKQLAYAIAYAMDCNHREILEDKAHREGWELLPCLPGFD